MSERTDVVAGREAFRTGSWAEACRVLRTADAASQLDPGHLEMLAAATYLTGDDLEADELWARAHHAYLDGADVAGAARCSFWLGMLLLLRGEAARSNGWLARGIRLLDDAGVDAIERDYLRYIDGVARLFSGAIPEAEAIFGEVLARAHTASDRELIALTHLAQAECLIERDRVSDAVAILDEVMVAVTTGELSPINSGIVYCAVLIACRSVFDVRRAGEWTSALDRWCAAQPDLVPYRGACRIHRSEVLQVRGEWKEAVVEAEHARAWLSTPPRPALGDAYYQLAELQRVRGEFADAETSYAEANRWGRDPQPGLALLRLSEGRIDAAAGAIRRALSAQGSYGSRLRTLAAAVDIFLEAGDIEAARQAATRLAASTRDNDAPYLTALTEQATGAVLLAGGDANEALPHLREALRIWQRLEAPYEAARTRLLTSNACRTLGDADTARLEADEAVRAFRELGAVPDVERATRQESPAGRGPLTARERDVLRLVATGKTNKAIAADLVISDKTVERHMSNIFIKLGVASRAAATAYWYEHGMT